jgi:diguanylate cyclase
VKTGTETDNWRKKYFDSLESLEKDQRRFQSMETALKRLAGRLCTASLGQSSRLDDEIKKLQKTLRRDVTAEELDQLTPALTDAIGALDQPPVAPTTVAVQPPKVQPESPKAQSASPVELRPQTLPESPPKLPQDTTIDDERVQATLSALLDELRRDPELVSQVEALDAKLAASMTLGQLPEVLSSLLEIVGQRIQRIERSKQEIEDLLSQMVGKLDEIGRFVAEQNQNQSQSQASSATLNIQLAGEMKAMGESVESAGDLQQIRMQVRSRLDSIDRHLQEFRQRETAMAGAIRIRNEQMRARVTLLEDEANRLHNQLKAERRLSTMDVLTKIPNRLAYEKRIEEELNRWRRFQQPTCIAVWDVDHFKRINDTCGHRAGDRVLSTVAECLAGRIRGTDFLARYGGEEFVMILSGSQLDDAVRRIDEMRIAISEIGFHFRGERLSVTISSGVTAFLAGDSASAAFDRADKAMYRAKENGRNRCVSM